MKALLIAAGFAVFAMGSQISGASAAEPGPRASSDNNWSGMAADAAPLAAAPYYAPAPYAPVAAPVAAVAPAAAPHYVYEQGYAHGGKWEGRWVMVP